MADVNASFKNWSTTAGSNLPSSSTTVGTGLAPNFQQIQATLRTELGTRSASLTAAATTDLSTKDEGTVLVSNAAGTVAITSFGTLSAGIKKLVTFSVTGGSLSITYNSTSMILPNASSVTVGDGDSLLAESLGSGNWKIHAYFQNVPTYNHSMVRVNTTVNTVNGYGTTNTVIPRFTNTVSSIGSDITYADSAANGASFTINTNGVYDISFTDVFTGAGGSDLGISLNASGADLTTGIFSITAANRLVGATTTASSQAGNCSVSVYLPAGSIIRPHTNGATQQSSASASFTITRVR